MNLQSQLEILTNFSCLHNHRAKFCIAEPTGDNLFKQEGRSVNQFADLHLFVLQHQLSFAVLTGNGFMLNA
jgi:hypothetical protein